MCARMRVSVYEFILAACSGWTSGGGSYHCRATSACHHRSFDNASSHNRHAHRNSGKSTPGTCYNHLQHVLLRNSVTEHLKIQL